MGKILGVGSRGALIGSAVWKVRAVVKQRSAPEPRARERARAPPPARGSREMSHFSSAGGAISARGATDA